MADYDPIRTSFPDVFNGPNPNKTLERIIEASQVMSEKPELQFPDESGAYLVSMGGLLQFKGRQDKKCKVFRKGKTDIFVLEKGRAKPKEAMLTDNGEFPLRFLDPLDSMRQQIDEGHWGEYYQLIERQLPQKDKFDALPPRLSLETFTSANGEKINGEQYHLGLSRTVNGMAAAVLQEMQIFYCPEVTMVYEKIHITLDGVVVADDATQKIADRIQEQYAFALPVNQPPTPRQWLGLLNSGGQ